jgi:hypothetical protein
MGLFSLSSSGASRGVDPFTVQKPFTPPCIRPLGGLHGLNSWHVPGIVGGGTIAQSVLRHDALDKFGRFGESSWG